MDSNGRRGGALQRRAAENIGAPCVLHCLAAFQKRWLACVLAVLYTSCHCCNLQTLVR